MRFHCMPSIAVVALSCLAWAMESATTASNSSIVLTTQLGPYPISIYEHELRTLRLDPLAPTPELRRIMVTIYRPFLDSFSCPLEHQSQIPYAPPAVAAALLQALLPNASSSEASSILAPVKLANCSRPIPSSSASGPLLLFSPGYGGTHHGYASTLQAAASSGYTVVAIDPTYEAAAVVFPDGYVAYPSAVTEAYDSTLDGENFLQDVRIADAVSVLDAIECGDMPGIGSYSRSSCNTNSNSTPACSSTPLRALMYGHSFGGSTAVNVAAIDARVLAAANIDGPYYGPVLNGTVHKPVFMMQSSALPATAANWPAFYHSHPRGWKTWVRPKNTVHYGYTDLPLLADLLGLRGTVIAQDLTGTVNSYRLREVVWRYTMQFFSYVLEGVVPDLLIRPSSEFPDVEFVGHTV